MGHMSVAVFTEEGQTVADALRPYDKNVEVSSEVLQSKKEFIREGRSSWRKASFTDYHNLPECPKKDSDVYEGLKKLYSAKGYRFDPLTGALLDLKNPEGRWDSWVIGGHFSGLLCGKEGSRVDSGKLSELCFDMTQVIWYRAARLWDITVEGAPRSKADDINGVLSRATKDNLLRLYGDRTTYCRCMASFHTFGVVHPSYGWEDAFGRDIFGFDVYIPSAERAWNLDYSNRFLKSADPSWTITIVDCHY